MTDKPDQGMDPQEDFATLWESVAAEYDYVHPVRGDIRKGQILSVSRNEVLVDIGAKTDAVVSSRDLETMDPEELAELAPGKEINVYIVRADDREGSLIVSINLARAYEDWIRAQELLESGDIIHITVSGYNKGGLVGAFGSIQGFIPASQITSLRPRGRSEQDGSDLAELVGKELPVKVIEVNRRRRRLILSERAAQREWRAAQRERLLSELREGDVRTGTVSNLCDFGAFVDLGGIDGLVHISELAWEHVNHPRDVLEVGQEVSVEVLRVDQERQRIGLSLKRTQPDPWQSIATRYSAGQVIEGVVTHLAKFGAFVELEPGIEGLVHVSELAEGNVEDPAQIVSEGDRLTVLILEVDANQRRISLSLRQAPVPERESTGETEMAREES
ncbi:MAG TPA: S1 RNA-binding domain-containing protein [Chloroflexi bacterium]|jgi:small subunit ribosomal protein S1|nr:S1 RNA-binding domain-containing protein [Chloroflexota bacterium]